jgi:hypothetical protein
MVNLVPFFYLSVGEYQRQGGAKLGGYQQKACGYNCSRVIG